MRVVLQRVSEARVEVKGEVLGEIEKGYLLLLGIEAADGQEDLEWLVKKILNLRLFNDEAGKMNLSLLEVGGEILVVSQFTLHASIKKGNRPSFTKSARPEFALHYYQKFIEALKKSSNAKVERGMFGADMRVSLVNSGPVTIVLDSKNKE